MKDLNDISAKTKIPVALLKRVLNILTPCPATTIEEVRDIFMFHEGSEEKQAALVRWGELSMEQATKAETLDEIREAFDNAPYRSEAWKTALIKQQTMFLEQIKNAKSVEEATSIYLRAPNDDQIKEAVILKVYELF